ncbi:MAG: RagB/SusD family nutrient uptake outer membrane protein [Massilibacteroides sp.]|nr:RagB/SusD family nutrient uptake outer membrane protein [Massilibacteroides sp.]MDD3061222.1 RagB/SusD family nutrient uptake outer membrane protein [Massilibacteroides sp.]MDD4115475.1 RagB/SusD family nutrient uptake outer membrane protein [Massilibacteroides sp.]MDD4661012.1 RagB/SusD family nutrient uptake outer membrane protein [Massilibacteroides sp.]
MKKIYKWSFTLLIPVLLTGCFDLEEKAYSEVIEKDFIATEQDVASLLASTYSPLTYIMNWQGYFDLQEEPGDCIITPTRPNGWDDGGTYRRMHQHEWTSEQWQPQNTYETCYSGINIANRILDQVKEDRLPTGDLKEATIAELRAIRAFWYAILLDTHGNVPLVTAFTDEIPTQATRQQVYDFVISELTEVLPDLKEEADATTYGRMNKWAAYMVLARVYLNAEVYTGAPQWEKALDCANKIIESGKYELSADYSSNFEMALDHTNKEVIFSVPYDRVYAGFGQFAKWYPPVSRSVFGSSYQCWGGSAANPQFINSYDVEDKRLEKTWLMGPQYSASTGELVWTCLNYIPSLTCSKDGVNKTSIDYGYRVWKYEYNKETSWNWENDFAYFRYAETLMIKAECLLRLGRDEDEAARLVSQIRARVFDGSKATVTVTDLKADSKIKYGTLDWDNNIDVPGDQVPVYLGGLYDEYGWEFACEAQRRTHMIRFGTYHTKNWFNHTAKTDGHTKIFPIPYSELTKNSNLKQNSGY